MSIFNTLHSLSLWCLLGLYYYYYYFSWVWVAGVGWAVMGELPFKF